MDKIQNQQTQLSTRIQFGVLLLALCLNLFVWFIGGQSDNAFLQIDSDEYLHLAQRLFSSYDFPSFFRTPVFPVFLGFWTEFLQFSLSQYILVQIVLSLINVYLLGRVAAYFVSARLQLAIMLLMAVDLVTVQVTYYVLSETLFSFLLLLSLNILASLKYQRLSYSKAVLCGLTLGLFALCRPVGQYLPYLLIIWFLFINTPSETERLNKRKLWLSAILILLCSSLVLQSWKWRNEQATGDSFISVTKSINMYNYRAAWNVAWRDGRPFIDVKQEFDKSRGEFVHQNPGLTPHQISQHFTKKGLDIIQATPVETAMQGMRGLVFLYGGIYNASLERLFGDGAATKIAKGYSYIYLLFIYFGILLCLLKHRTFSAAQRAMFSLSIIVVAYFTLLSIGVESYARLRSPFMPYLVMVSAIGYFQFFINEQPSSPSKQID